MPKAKRARKLVGDEANFRQLLRVYKRSARKRGHAFKITPERFRELTKSHCYLCGNPPSREYRHSLKNPRDPYVCNGVDRFDNSKGYVEGNVITCCGSCNALKGTASVEKLLLKVYDIYTHVIKSAIEEGVPQDEHEENE